MMCVVSGQCWYMEALVAGIHDVCGHGDFGCRRGWCW